MVGFLACEKETPQSEEVIDDSHVNLIGLTDSEKELKANLHAASMIISEIAAIPEVVADLRFLSENDNNKIPFRKLLLDEDLLKSHGIGLTHLKNAVKNAFEVKTKSTEISLLDYLSENNCYLYIPYPVEWYEANNQFFTVAAHPIDNEEEGPGYYLDNDNRLNEVIVNYDYGDNYPVVLLMPNYDDYEDYNHNPTKTSQNSVNEVRLGHFRYSVKTNMFTKDMRMFVMRGTGAWDPVNSVVTGTWPTQIEFMYSRQHAKAAYNNWTQYKNGGWLEGNIPWDTNWKVESSRQAIAVYQYRNVSTQTYTTKAGYKDENWAAEQTVAIQLTYKGIFLGANDWDRNWELPGYYNVNRSYEKNIRTGIIL